MRFAPSLLLVLLPSAALAQAPDAAKQETIKYLHRMQMPSGGFISGLPQDDVAPVPNIRGTSAAVRSLKYLTGQPVKDAVPNVAEVTEFVMSCYDPQTGGFAGTPGVKPDVPTTCIGVMAAVELGVPREKFRKAMDYIKEHAKTWEEVRLGAAAVEAWGVKDCPFDLKPWLELARKDAAARAPFPPADRARDAGSFAAFYLRLGQNVEHREGMLAAIREGRRDDGGWGKPAEKASDMETTYRVMRALVLMKEKPADAAKLREFIGKCRNDDHGYGVKPGDKSSVSGVYYASIVAKWLDEMEKK